MRDRPKTKSQRKAWFSQTDAAAQVRERAEAVTNPAVTGSSDRLDTLGITGTML